MAFARQAQTGGAGTCNSLLLQPSTAMCDHFPGCLVGQENGALPLLEAIRCARADLVKAVLEAGCDSNQLVVRGM